MPKIIEGMDALEADVMGIGVILGSEPLYETMASCAEVVLGSVDLNFQEAVSPDGDKWPPRLTGGDWPLLIQTGALRAAATGKGAGSVKRVSERELVVGVDKSVEMGGIPGAGVHNFGYPERNIAKRKFMAPRADAIAKCGEILAEDVDKKIG